MALILSNRKDLLDALKNVSSQLSECEAFDRQLSHAAHRSDYYLDLINRVTALVEAEKALQKRIDVIGR